MWFEFEHDQTTILIHSSNLVPDVILSEILDEELMTSFINIRSLMQFFSQTKRNIIVVVKTNATVVIRKCS